MQNETTITEYLLGQAKDFAALAAMIGFIWAIAMWAIVLAPVVKPV